MSKIKVSLAKINSEINTIVTSTKIKEPIDKLKTMKMVSFGQGKWIAVPKTVSHSWLQVKKHLREKSESWGNRFSDEMIDSLISQFVADIKHKKRTGKISVLVRNWINELKTSNVETIIFVRPIHNLILKKNTKVGKVRIVNLKTRHLNSLIDNPEHSGLFSTRELCKRSIEINKTETFAIIEVIALDSDRAKEISIEYLEKVLNAMRLFNSTAHFLSGENYMALKHHVVLEINNDRDSYADEFQNLNQYIPQIMPSQGTANLKPTWGILSKFLFSNHLSDLQSRILTALYWYGEAFKDKNPPSAFLKYITSLETMLIFENTYDKSKIIAERLSSIIYTKKGRGKKSCYDTMKRYYDLRSDIVHSGKTLVFPEDAETVRYWSQLILQNYIRSSKKYKDVKTLLKKRFHVSL